MTQGKHTVNKLTTMYSRKGTRENARDTHCKVQNYVFPQRNKRNRAYTKQVILERNSVFPLEKYKLQQGPSPLPRVCSEAGKKTTQFLLGCMYFVYNLNLYLFFLRVSFLKTNYVISKIEKYV
jgi:hypothetical protein